MRISWCAGGADALTGVGESSLELARRLLELEGEYEVADGAAEVK